jgi:tetratricopeptide (TPR) repeat protein
MTRWLEKIDSALSSGNLNRAEEMCNRLILLSGRDCEQAIIAREKLAHIKLRGGDYTCAARMFEELISIATDLDNRSMVGRGYLSLGTAYLRLGDYQSAEDSYRAALHVFRWQVRDKQWAARCYANLGILFKMCES